MGRIPDKFAIMTVDPGGTTGVAQGLFNVSSMDRVSTRKVMARAVRKDVLRVEQLYAATAYRDVKRLHEVSMAIGVYRAWLSFSFKCLVELAIPMPYIFLVIESFELRQRSADLSPVGVTQGLLTLLATGEIDPGAAGMTWPSIRVDQQLRFQEPATAMTYATNERLREWGVYGLTVGKEHGRDAMRHLCLAASEILDGNWNDPVRSGR